MNACGICGGVTPVPKAHGQAPKYCGDMCRLVARGNARQHLRDTQLATVRERNRLKQSAWRSKHPEAFRTYRRKHYAANKTRIREMRDKAHNPAKEREWSRKSYEAHREQRLAAGKLWQRGNLHKFRIYGSTRRAMELAVFVEDVDHCVVFTRDKGMCGICRTPVDPSSPWEIDHIIPISKQGPHSYANVQLSHRKCNRSKSARMP